MAAGVEKLRFEADGGVPNNPRLPAVLISGAMPATAGSEAILSQMAGNGWRGGWTYTVFDFHHYHPNAHEALVAARGWADIQLGGPSGPIKRIEAGDALVLPAGVGHRRHAASADFAICGAYPQGQENYETNRAGEGRKDDAARIAKTPLPQSDPIAGVDGPLIAAWRLDQGG